MVTTQISHQIVFTTFLENKFGKIKINFQRSLKGGLVKADFLHGEKIDYAEKKSSK